MEKTRRMKFEVAVDIASWLWPFSILFFVTVIVAPNALRADDTCTSEQAELFSCMLKSKTAVALCLDKEKLTTQLMRINPQGTRTETPISDLKQIVHPGAHGSPTALQGQTSQGKVTLFVDPNYYDMTKPVLTTTNGKLTHTEFCSNLKFNTPASMIKIKNELVSINLFRLLGYGISSPLDEDEEPDWPDQGQPRQ